MGIAVNLAYSNGIIALVSDDRFKICPHYIIYSVILLHVAQSYNNLA